MGNDYDIQIEATAPRQLVKATANPSYRLRRQQYKAVLVLLQVRAGRTAITPTEAYDAFCAEFGIDFIMSLTEEQYADALEWAIDLEPPQEVVREMARVASQQNGG